jgi:glycosyltransferase involved in cell wall biosynthesis
MRNKSIKVCLAGNYSRPERAGSSILKVQHQLFKNLNGKDVHTIFFESTEKKNIFYKLFDRLIFIQIGKGTLVRGGVIRLFFYLKKNDYTIIHFIDDRYYMGIICIFNLVLKAKIIVTFHDILNFRDYKKKLLPHVLRIIFIKFCTLILVFNKDDMILLRKKYPNKKISIVRSGVDTKFFSYLKSESTENIVLFCGGLSLPYKGLRFLEYSLMKIEENHKLIICGKNEKNDKHNAYIGELAPSEIKEMYQKARVVVVPSKYDAFSLTVLEAMACGVPTILTYQCGISNYLENGVGCFIVNYGNAEELAQRISTLLKDNNLWQKMSKDAVETSRDFEWQKISMDYITQYYKLSTT